MFRDFTGRSFGDAFGCPCSGRPMHGVAMVPSLHPTLPPPTMKAFGTVQNYGRMTYYGAANKPSWASSGTWVGVIQQELVRLGAYSGAIDGLWGSRTESGLNNTVPGWQSMAPDAIYAKLQSMSPGARSGKVDWNSIAGAAGSLISSITNRQQPTSATSVPPPMYPTTQMAPAPAAQSWVGPAAAVGGTAIIGLLVYMLTRGD